LKKFLRKMTPIFIGLGLAAIIISSYIFLVTGAVSPEKAVTGYLKASITQDVNGMVKYASDYEKVSLYGSKKFSNNALKSSLKTSYADAENIYADNVITFSIISITEIEPESDEYTDIVENYEYLVGNSDFSEAVKVEVKVFVDGKQKQKSTVYAVKSGLRWYYGY